MTNDDVKFCTQCGKPIESDAAFCMHCGSRVMDSGATPNADTGSNTATATPTTANPVGSLDKNRITAGVLAIVLGGFGVHKFYLGKIGLGIVYILFCWTGIPSIIGLVEGIIYLTSTDEQFYTKYAR